MADRIFDEKGARPRQPKPFLAPALAAFLPGYRAAIAHATEVEVLRAKGKAVGLADDELDDLEAGALELSDYTHRLSETSGAAPLSIAAAMRWLLDRIIAGDRTPLRDRLERDQ